MRKGRRRKRERGMLFRRSRFRLRPKATERPMSRFSPGEGTMAILLCRMDLVSPIFDWHLLLHPVKIAK